MFKISSVQLDVLRNAASQLQVKRMACEILTQLQETNSELVQTRSTEETLQVIQQVIRAAVRYEILDFEDLCKWAYIRLATNQEFYNHGAFRYFLDEPLIHPKAKARNIVTSFLMAAQGRS